MKSRVVVLGAGFGGLELTARLSAALPDEVEITLIDKNDSFVFGFSKFEVMFGRQTLDQVRCRYRDIVKPGVTFRQEVITAIDPAGRRVTTDGGQYDADILVVALGADHEPAATPGLVGGGYEFYSVEGAARLREALPAFAGGDIVIAVVSEPFKCPPAPCEAAMLLHECLTERGRRADATITVVSPWGIPIPASGPASDAILAAFAANGVRFVPNQGVTALDVARNVVQLRDGVELPCDLFLGIPRHRVPDVVEASGMAVDGWIPVDRSNLSTRYGGVYAIGDVTSAPVPKAGIFAESAARAVAADIVYRLRGGERPKAYDGAGACFIEFGGRQVGRVDVDFLTGPGVVAPFTPASEAGAVEKREFAASRRALWFGS